MDKTIEFLSTLSKEELAFFHKYKFPTFTKATQAVILDYMHDNGMTSLLAEEIVSKHKSSLENNEHHNVCPRCTSTKILVDRIESEHTKYTASTVDLLPYMLNDIQAEPEYDHNLICAVCGYWVKHESQDEKRSFWSFLGNLFDSL